MTPKKPAKKSICLLSDVYRNAVMLQLFFVKWYKCLPEGCDEVEYEKPVVLTDHKILRINDILRKYQRFSIRMITEMITKIIMFIIIITYKF